MKVLITGITGFVGSHLAEYILGLNEGHEIYGLCRWRSPRDNLANVINQIELIESDLLDLSGLIRHMENVKPDVIIHMAAQSFVQTSFNTPIHTLQVNGIGTCNLLESVRITGIDPIIIAVSSSEVYGQVGKDDIPIKETCPFRPASPYAVSKITEDMLAFQYWLSYGLKTIRTRMFSHTGERRGDAFFTSAFAKQIAAIELELQPPVIRVGNLDSVRTLLDVHDAVRAYWILINKGKIGEVYNIGGVETKTVGEVLNILISLSKAKLEVKVDEALLRPSDVTMQIPCIDRFKEATGWEPKIPISVTLENILNYWRQELIKNPWKVKSVER